MSGEDELEDYIATPSKEEIDELFDEHSVLTEDPNYQKFKTVAKHFMKELGVSHDRDDDYCQIMNEAGYDPDSQEDALRYMGELSSELEQEHDVNMEQILYG